MCLFDGITDLVPERGLLGREREHHPVVRDHLLSNAGATLGRLWMEAAAASGNDSAELNTPKIGAKL